MVVVVVVVLVGRGGHWAGEGRAGEGRGDVVVTEVASPPPHGPRPTNLDARRCTPPEQCRLFILPLGTGGWGVNLDGL